MRTTPLRRMILQAPQILLTDDFTFISFPCLICTERFQTVPYNNMIRPILSMDLNFITKMGLGGGDGAARKFYGLAGLKKDRRKVKGAHIGT